MKTAPPPSTGAVANSRRGSLDPSGRGAVPRRQTSIIWLCCGHFSPRVESLWQEPGYPSDEESHENPPGDDGNRPSRDEGARAMLEAMTAVHHPVPGHMAEENGEHHHTESSAGDVREQNAQRAKREDEGDDFAQRDAEVERHRRDDGMSAGELPVV